MALSLAELSAGIAKTTAKSENSGYWDKFYAFWKMEVGEHALVRFLEDQDPNNTMGFVVENLTHKLEINGRERTLPCLKMYGKSCPCCELSRKYYAEKNEALGLKYWRRQDFIGQVLIQKSPFEYPPLEDGSPVRLISIGPKIFKLIQASFASGDLLENPTSLTAGYDFRIAKTQNGKYADYMTSKFVPLQSAVDESVIANITLNNLADFRTAEISREAMEAAITAYQNGGDIEDTDGRSSSSQGGETTQVSNSPSAQVSAAVSTPKQGVTVDANSAEKDGGDILARIRARAAAKA